MIQCTPHSIFSAGFTLSGSIPDAVVDFSWFTESGTISFPEQSFEIKKDGMFSGRWLLGQNGRTVMVAEKTSAFRRAVEIKYQDNIFYLRAQSAFGRSMNLTGPGTMATIEPAHPFTRRSTISGSLPGPAVTAFAFWLTALLWKRAANNNNNNN